MAYANGDKVPDKPPLPSKSYPLFTVAVKGQQVSIKFQIPPACEVSQMNANLVSHLGVRIEDRDWGGLDMLLRAWDNAVAWQLAPTHPEKKVEIKEDVGN
ncbi:hypothetical protein CIPAW_03G125600 [Carya illinoinensis]|uniref:Uncharacterized protein n=1 Tax=Carya illinoinensis TaxID=32201 RepID=A0A8T1R1K5_CARIL|nr:hypothetical protein CIPAW_03G125600 [Carya illinoinensis]